MVNHRSRTVNGFAHAFALLLNGNGSGPLLSTSPGVIVFSQALPII